MIYNGPPPSADYDRAPWGDKLMAGAVVLGILIGAPAVIGYGIYYATHETAPKTYTVTTPDGRTIENLKVAKGGYHWISYETPDGREVTIIGPHTQEETPQ